jgi:hypothetical protein
LNRLYTHDGSTTIQIKEWDECYHSKHGAVKAQHVFIKMDCLYFKTNKFQYWNWFWYDWMHLLLEGKKINQSITWGETYHLEELVPWITSKNWMLWITKVFWKMHQSNGEKRESEMIFINKRKQCLKDWWFGQIWSDLWCFRLSCATRNGVLQYSKNVWCTQNNGVLTYAARGVVKSMIEVGFKVENGSPREKRNVSCKKIVVNWFLFFLF